MHFFLATAEIKIQPKLIRIRNQYCAVMLVSLPNNKKTIESLGQQIYVYIYIYLKNDLIPDFFDLYSKGNFIFIESDIKIKYNSFKSKNLKLKKHKYIEIQVSKIQ